MPESTKVTVDVQGRHLTLSNLGKVLFPVPRLTKGEVIDYYSRIAAVLLPHLADRPLTVKRYPNGVDGMSFFEKNATRGTPDWVRTVTLPVPGSSMNRDTIDYVVVEGLPTLVWLANLAALELHVPQWRVPPRDTHRSSTRPRTDLVVFDLDPGAPATIEQCREVALLLRELLGEDGLAPVAKTSGSKGMQVSAPVRVDDPDLTSRYAHAVAQRLEHHRPELIVSRMAKNLRPHKVLVDWSQNNPAKTTVAPYSLRAREHATVSTPLSWDEVAGEDVLSFTTADVLARVEAHGDLFAAVLDDGLRVRITEKMART